MWQWEYLFLLFCALNVFPLVHLLYLYEEHRVEDASIFNRNKTIRDSNKTSA